MLVPIDLAKALSDLPSDPRFKLTHGWMQIDGLWCCRFRTKLSVPATEYVSEWTSWYLVVFGDLLDPDVRIYPDSVDGVVSTFPHQDYNSEPSIARPWRLGKPCLERPAAVFQRNGWSGEPSDFAERLIWRIGRLLCWIDAAATDNLLRNGDPLELPVNLYTDPTSVLGFRETIEDKDWIAETGETWGFASISVIPEARDTAVISSFMSPERKRLRSIKWSKSITVDCDRIDAVWVTLPKLVVFAPWRNAANWQELSELCESVDVDLPQILADAGAKLRRIQRPKLAGPVHLLVGFPLQERLGDPPLRFHWLAVQNMSLCTRNDVRRGFSSLPGARRKWDRELATSTRALEWRPTANWAPDQLRKRGEAECEIRSKSVMILGVGTLGAAIAENLLRMGVTNLALLDVDRMGIGNLSRHVLTSADAGWLKTESLAKRLNKAALDANVISLPFGFPPANADQAKKLKGWEVVIDCTASDAVLKAMGAFPWVTERLFVTLAMTWEAKGMFAYTASETGFPFIDAMQRFNDVSLPPDVERVGEMEGMGCWHPVFPATADDVNLWAAIGSKFVRQAVLTRAKVAAIFFQREDGSVERKDA